MAESLLFGFPVDDTQDGVRFYLMNDGPLPGTNVFETFYRLDIQFNDQVESFRLPHDLEQLWQRLRSTPTDTSMSGLAGTLPSTLPEDTTGSMSSPVTPPGSTSSSPTKAELL